MDEQYMILISTCDDDFLRLWDSHLSKDDADSIVADLQLEVDEFGREVYEQIIICQHTDFNNIR